MQFCVALENKKKLAINYLPSNCISHPQREISNVLIGAAAHLTRGEARRAINPANVLGATFKWVICCEGFN